MKHRYCFEALDKTLRSITHVPKPFGGKVVVLGGDFRQILHVVLKASRQDIVHATINSSQLWEDCKVLKLHTNMRLQSSSNPSEVEEVKKFADWILSIGNGEAGEQNDDEASVEIPEDMLIPDSEDPLLQLLQREAFAMEPNFKLLEWELMFLAVRFYPAKIPVMLVPSNSTLPIKFQRQQFPLMVSLAMTINKSQGQTLSHVSLYLPRPVFSHIQLYVALSRVKIRSGIKILIKSESGGLSSSTSNVVYKKVFQRI
ncbi:PREDICTED: uncharacterized protein LOC105960287 [Erythranthe guttata]|uniref:uncharacterized protein LOC105960287 n=1 Tax=Erythranthe guttata TaxID=4155 RepID=UPI00064DA3F0|nr:PREDICTED: uncharacterized protein LOC105960287 [Erythranthe guttata]|eukprot:XP_012839907.1 PREDICTED: uncharacterized protein LOC105960287 [Erythranthe guttata]